MKYWVAKLARYRNMIDAAQKGNGFNVPLAGTRSLLAAFAIAIVITGCHRLRVGWRG
jgi:hypothetical protein